MATEFRVHDPLCRQRMQPYEENHGRCPDCELILQVRAEERYDSADSSKPFQDGYLVGRTVAALAIREQVERLSNPATIHYPGCWQEHASCAMNHAAEIAANEE